MYCRHKCFHTLFDLLKYGLMSNYNVMCSSLDPMEELTAAPPYPSWSRTGHGSFVPPPPPHKLEILDPSLKLNVLSCQDQLNRMPLLKESPLKNLIPFFLRPHPSWGWLQMTNSFCCLYLLFSVSVTAPFIKMLDPCTHNVHVLHVCACLLIVTYM